MTQITNNFTTCCVCYNNLLFHPNYIKEFIKKNIYKNKKFIILAYRLIPDLNNYVDSDYISEYMKIVSNIANPLYLYDTENIFRSYFYQENLPYTSYNKCCNCRELFCQLHERLQPMINCKCICNLPVTICNWCHSTIPFETICMNMHSKKVDLFITCE